METFLELNGINIESTDDALIQLGLGIASGQIGQEVILEWIVNHSSKWFM